MTGVPDQHLLEYITKGSAAAPRAVVETMQRSLADNHLKRVNLTADWLNSLLPHVLSKVDRVHYGLLSPREVDDALRYTHVHPLYMYIHHIYIIYTSYIHHTYTILYT